MSPTPLTPPALLPVGPFTTLGSQIIDPAGASVRLCGVNWNWYNGPNSTPEILSSSFSYQQCLKALVNGGINTVVICTSDASVIQNKPLNANTTSNPDLINSTYNSGLQTVVNYGYSIGLQFIIESHNSEGNNIINQGQRNPNGLWYDVGGLSNGTDGGNNTGTITDTLFVYSWQIRANLFSGNLGVLGYNLRNEPLCFGSTGSGCNWGPYGPSGTTATAGAPNDLVSMYERVGNAILAIDPSKLIICEGPINNDGSFLNIGNAPWGDLSAVQNYPVILNIPNKVVYSQHIYPSEVMIGVPDNGIVYQQYYNTGGYLANTNIAPYFIGACGDSLTSSDAVNWANMFIPWINGNFSGQGALNFDTTIEQGVGWAWWKFNLLTLGNSPQFGILSNTGLTVEPVQASYWQQILPWPVQNLLFSSFNTSIPVIINTTNGESITDSNNNVYTLTSDGVLQENGISITGGSNISQVTIINNVIWTEDSSSGIWYTFVNGSFISQIGAPFSPALTTSSILPISSSPLIGPSTLIQFLNSIAGNFTISGQFVETCGADGFFSGFMAIQTIHALTGYWLGLIEGDYYHSNSTGSATLNFNNTAINYWNNGGLISLSLRIPNPTSGGTADDGQPCNFNDLLTPGTPTNLAWMNSLSQIASGLTALQNAGVIVLLRIYHKAGTNNFWWGPQNATPQQYISMWQATYAFFTTTNQLTNLVWVSGGIADYSYFPGNAYVDVIGQDGYSINPYPDFQNIYNTLTQGANGLPYGLTEFGPTISGFDQTILINTFNQSQPLTTYWVQWWNSSGMQNSINLTAALSMPRVLNRGEFVLPTNT